MSFNKKDKYYRNKSNSLFNEDFNPFEFLFGDYYKTKVCDSRSEAEDHSKTSIGKYLHAEGDQTEASGNSSHAEGQTTIASGANSHAAGNQTEASGNSSHAEGQTTIASGANSHAEGNQTEASGNSSHAEGQTTIASGANSHAEGNQTEASGNSSHAEGNQTEASGNSSHAEGNQTEASGNSSHAEGNQTEASGFFSHAEGFLTAASGNSSHAEGQTTVASGANSHAEGSGSQATGINSHAEGQTTVASGFFSHAEGFLTAASGNSSHAEGQTTVASGANSHAEGSGSQATGINSHAEGAFTTASGLASHAGGANTIAINDYQTVIGRFNRPSNPDNNNLTQDDAFIIGSGDSLTQSNAFRVQFNGQVFTAVGGAYNVGGADFAEFFEWQDGNSNLEDRIGYFVTLDGEQIKFATSSDYVLGVSSGTAGFIGNSPDNKSPEGYETDEFGRLIYENQLVDDSKLIDTRREQLEDLIYQPQNKIDKQNDELKKRLQESIQRITAIITKIKDENILKELEETQTVKINEEMKRLEEQRDCLTQRLANIGQEQDVTTNIMNDLTKQFNELKPTSELRRVPKLNLQYDLSQSYTPRSERPEWETIALIGKVAVRDDGSCQVNEYCHPDDAGKATASLTGYRVLKRVNNEVIIILLR